MFLCPLKRTAIFGDGCECAQTLDWLSEKDESYIFKDIAMVKGK